MNKQEPSENNPSSTSEPSIQQQVENSTLGGGMQALQGDGNTQIQGQVVTFNQTQILQILTDEIKSRQFIEFSPYKGLKKFEPEDKHLFFGRDQFLTGLVNELEQTNLILLLGASGSGKSSVVRAGLVPWLSQKYGSQLVHLMFTPDQDPFESFYASLLRYYTQQEAKIAREANTETLAQVVRSLKQSDDFWFIFIDQFEELFTTSLPNDRDQFIDGLVKLSKTKLPSVKIMLTMRADFLDKLSPYPQLVKATDKHRPMIAEMQPEELRLAIEQPAVHHGVVFETGLIKEIVKDIQGQAGYLPLLQYTLNLLWETERKTGSINDRTLNNSTYHSLGGVRGALQQYVDKIYGNLLPEEKLAAQRIFLKLVGIGESSEPNTEWKPVRRRAWRSEFSNELERIVLVKLINENLLVSDHKPQAQESTVEITHETLLTSWTTLNTWIKENRQGIALRNRLSEDVAVWQERKKDERELWAGGSRLEKALELRKDPTFNLVLGGFSEAANQFINASVGLRDRQRRKTITVLASFLVMATTAALIAFAQYCDATRQRISAELKAMSANSEVLATEGKHFDALIESLRTGVKLERSPFGVEPDARNEVIAALQQAISQVLEKNRLEGHTYSVSSLSFSPDGQVIASASQDGKIRLWNLNGKMLKILNGHEDVVNGISFSPNGELIVSASGDGTVRFWRKDGSLLRLLEEKPQKFKSVSFSPDSREIVAATDIGTVELWDGQGNHKTLSGHNGWVNSVSFSPDGQMIASAGDDKTIKLWNRNDGTLRKTLKGHTGAVNSVSFSRDGSLVSGGEDKMLILWGRDGKQPKMWTGHTGAVNSVSFSSDGQTIASASSDKTIKLWNLNGDLLATLQGHTDIVNWVSFSPDGQAIASASGDNTIKLWHINNKELQTFNQLLSDVPKSVSVSPSGTLVASIRQEPTSPPDSSGKLVNNPTYAINLWMLDGKRLGAFSKPHNLIELISFSPSGDKIASVGEEVTKPVGAISASPKDEEISAEPSFSGKTAVVNVSNSVVKLWNLKGEVLKTVPLDLSPMNVHSLRFSPNGKLIALAGGDGTVKLWDLDSNSLRTLQAHAKPVSDVNFSPDGIAIATASYDYTIKLWSLDGKLLHTLAKHRDGINSISFSHDGQAIASASNDGTIQIWSREGKPLRTLKGHVGAVHSVSFSPDGNLIVSGGEDKTVKLWSRNGTLLKTLHGHNAEVLHLSFNPSGTKLISTSEDNQVIVWDFNLETLMQQGCKWLQDYLTTNINVSQEEKLLCKQYEQQPNSAK